MMTGMSGVLDQLTAAFRAGGGVPQSAYADDMWDGMERFTINWFENLLTQQWLPAMPDVQAKLERGAQVGEQGGDLGELPSQVEAMRVGAQSRHHIARQVPADDG